MTKEFESAICSQDCEAAKIAIKNASIEEIRKDDDFLLQLCCVLGCPIITKLVLGVGADPNCGDGIALRHAASFGNADCLAALLEAGGDPSKITEIDFDLARLRGRLEEVQKSLKEHKKKSKFRSVRNLAEDLVRGR